MNMPGLSAEASLYKSTARYFLGSAWAGVADSHLGLSQLKVPFQCNGPCPPPPHCHWTRCLPNPAQPGACQRCLVCPDGTETCDTCVCPCPPGTTTCTTCTGGSCGTYPTCTRISGTMTCTDCHGNVTHPSC
jgi:hypothetical protein